MSEAKKRPRPIIIGVTGGSGSGKTSVSRAIFDQLHGHSLMMLQEDSYYKSQDDVPFEERTKVNYDHPNAFDTDLLIEQLEDLLNWKTIEIPVYDYAAHTRSKEVVVQECAAAELFLVHDRQRRYAEMFSKNISAHSKNGMTTCIFIIISVFWYLKDMMLIR